MYIIMIINVLIARCACMGLGNAFPYHKHRGALATSENA